MLREPRRTEAMKQILVVEDDRAIRETLTMLLEMEGYSVLAAENGADGLATLATMDTPCLILLDLMMPVMNGWEFIEAKGKDDHIATIPVLITSAVAERADATAVAGVIKKPIDIEALLKFVKQFCGPPAN